MHLKTISMGLLLALMTTHSAWSALSAKQVLQKGQHCVAWRTAKTLALVKRAEAIGLNCNITVQASQAGANKYQAKVIVPIRDFNSQEKDRDKEVLNILQASKQPNIEFTTLPLTLDQWKGMLSRGQGAVRGTLKIAGRSYPVNSVAKVRQSGGNIEVYGVVQTKFTSLGIPAPQVGPGGSIAKVDDYLELHYNLVSTKVKDFNLVK